MKPWVFWNKPAMKQMLNELVVAVSSGQSLSEAMATHGDIFGPLYISMIRVGETGGILEQTTTQLSRILARDEKVKTTRISDLTNEVQPFFRVQLPIMIFLRVGRSLHIAVNALQVAAAGQIDGPGQGNALFHYFVVEKRQVLLVGRPSGMGQMHD